MVQKLFFSEQLRAKCILLGASSLRFPNVKDRQLTKAIQPSPSTIHKDSVKKTQPIHTSESFHHSPSTKQKSFWHKPETYNISKSIQRSPSGKQKALRQKPETNNINKSWWEPWSSGNKRFIFQRSWVRIPAPLLDGHFFTYLFVVGFVMRVWRRRK